MKINMLFFVSSFVFLIGMGGLLVEIKKGWFWDLIIILGASLGYSLITWLCEEFIKNEI